MDPVLASSIDFESFLKRQKELNLSVAGRSVSQANRRFERERDRNARRLQAKAEMERRQAGLESQGGRPIKHQWGLHVPNRQKPSTLAPISPTRSDRAGGGGSRADMAHLDIDAVSSSAGTERSPPRPIWGSSAYSGEPDDIVFLEEEKEGRRRRAVVSDRGGGDGETTAGEERTHSDAGVGREWSWDAFDEEYLTRQYSEAYVKNYHQGRLEANGNDTDDNTDDDDELPPAWSPPRKNKAAISTSSGAARGRTETDKLCRSMERREMKGAQLTSQRKRRTLSKYMHLWRRGAWASKQEHAGRDAQVDGLQRRVLERRAKEVFGVWRRVSRVRRLEAASRARLLRRTLQRWRWQGEYQRVLERQAAAHFAEKEKERCWREWKYFYRRRKQEEREAVLTQVADKFRHLELLRKTFGWWTHRRVVRLEAEALDSEQVERRNRISSFLDNIKAKNAVPPAPPNTPHIAEPVGLSRVVAGASVGTNIPRKPKVPRLDRDKLAAAAERRRALRQRHEEEKKAAYEDRERKRREAEESKERHKGMDIHRNGSGNRDGGEEKQEQQLDDIALSERLQRQRFLRRQAEERVAKRRAQDQELEEKRAQAEDEEVSRIKEARRKEVLAQRGLQQRRQELAERKDERRQKIISASRHFRRAQLLVRWGLSPWQQLLAIRREREDMADEFCNTKLVTKMWFALSGYFWAVRRARTRHEHAQSHLAGAHHKQGLIKSHFRAWALYRRMLKAKAKAVTGAFSRFSALKRSWKAWGQAQERARRREAMLMRTFAAKGNRSVQRFYLQRWRQFAEDSALDREAANRADETWSKVQAWLRK